MVGYRPLQTALSVGQTSKTLSMTLAEPKTHHNVSFRTLRARFPSEGIERQDLEFMGSLNGLPI